MNKIILKEFAIESRKDLMEKIKLKLKLYFIDEHFESKQNGDMYTLTNENHILNLTKNEYKKRELLKNRINEVGVQRGIEEAAYTWFNRLIAIRYMEIHDFLPLGKNNESLGIKVLSSKDNAPFPEIMNFSNLINSQLDININVEKYSSLNNDNEKFKYILQLICIKLKKVFPIVFNGNTDYIDILIPENMLSDTGFVTKLVKTINEDDFNEVEIIGWLYQYYNQTEKDRVITAKNIYKKNEIAYASQLFTPDWIVKYMVENSLGKYYLIHGGDKEIKSNWKYYINEELEKSNYISPEKIKFIDPCCGSGHILVYAFEVFYSIYEYAGYNKKDIPSLILKNNLYGLDIDDRAGQLSVLSVLLKARKYDKDLFSKNFIQDLNIISLQESSNIDLSLSNSDLFIDGDINTLIDNFMYAKEVGSLTLVEKHDYSNTLNKLQNNIFDNIIAEQLKPLIKQSEILANKYDVIVTNPPYINNSLMNNNIKKYVNNKFNDYKGDLFSCFMYRNTLFAKEGSIIGFMTSSVWMYLTSYIKLRRYITSDWKIDTLLELAKGSFNSEASVDICAFTLRKKDDTTGLYVNLNDYKANIDSQEKGFLSSIENIDNSKNIYKCNSNEFKKIDGNPISYWVPQKIYDTFNNKKLIEIAEPKTGMSTTNNNLFTRMWYEVALNKLSFDSKTKEEAINSHKKWFPYNKGGEAKKWYGNNDCVVNWENDGFELKEYTKGASGGRMLGLDYFYKECFTWSMISATSPTFRYKEPGSILSNAGPSCYGSHDDLMYLLGILNCNYTNILLKVINPTLNTKVGDIASLPIKVDLNLKYRIISIVEENIKLSKEDWDLFETSWNFKKHPLIINNCKKIEEAMQLLKEDMNNRFNKVYENEKELNEIVNKLYDIENDMVTDNLNITINKLNQLREIKSLISYCVGVMFGRYSLDEEGLVLAGSELDFNRYKSYKPDNDNIIPLSESSKVYYEDDLYRKFKDIIAIIYGNETLDENLEFIATTLGKKGTESAEDTIRRYVFNDFYTEHCKIYQKRPIYWMIDSGKKGGFKCLIYSHRYNNKILSAVRVNYLHKTENTYEKLLEEENYRISNIALNVYERKMAQNMISELTLKISECEKFDEILSHLANKMISIDLDDGVKVNYEKFADILAKIK